MRLSATLLLAGLLFSFDALAQTAGTCATGTAQRDLDTSDVLARLFNTGALFYGNGSEGAYLTPYDPGSTNNRSPIYSAALWVGGTVGGQLRMTAATYNNFEFWPGPLDAGGVLPNPTDCSAYNRIYVVSAADVAAYDRGGTPTPDLAAWPVGLGAAAVTSTGTPVVPTSRAQVANLAAGERPVVYGSQTAFWVMNDVGNMHVRTGTPPIGLEVQATAFAIASPDSVVSRSTFYRYRLVNRSTQTLESGYAGLYVDPDLGNAGDDFIGSDSTRGLLFAYNADNFDDGSVGYGVNPPAVGVDLLSGAGQLMVIWKSGPFPTGEPRPGIALDYYRYLQALWMNGTPLREGGIGYGAQATGPVRRAVFPGLPETGAYWSERNSDGAGGPNTPGDRRFVIATPAFTLAPGQSRDVDLGIVFARGANNLDSVARLRAGSDRVQRAYDDGSLWATVPLPAEPPTPEPDEPTAFALLPPAPNPSLAGATLGYKLATPARVRLAVYDVLGREVAVLVDGQREAGRHEPALAARLPAGTYVAVLTADGLRATRRLTVSR